MYGKILRFKSLLVILLTTKRVHLLSFLSIMEVVDYQYSLN